MVNIVANNSKKWLVWISLLGLGILTGIGSFFYQVTNGLGVTGLSNTITWGMYIVSFMFLVGMSAGGLIVVAGAELIGSKRFEHLNKIAVVCSLASVATAAGSILPDLGRPFMAWKMIISPNLTSPLVWDMGVLTIYFLIGAIDLYILTREPVPRKVLRVMALVSLPVAILVHSITAWIFGLLVARPFWNTPLLAPLFISSALVSGTALVVATSWCVERLTTWRVGSDTYDALRRILVWFVSADIFFLTTEIMTTFVSGEPDHRQQLDIVLTGKLAPIFWFEIFVGVFTPVALLVLPSLKRRVGLIVLASVLLIFGVFAKRINILFAAEFEPLVNLAPGIPGGRAGQQFRPDEIYIPTFTELGVLIGMASLFFSIVTLGVQKAVLQLQT
ncbi:MAG: oxidoreductase [Actinobacteria bacterium]|nr:oxidoreductase [Actinomycetota bacterium]